MRKRNGSGDAEGISRRKGTRIGTNQKKEGSDNRGWFD